MVLDHCPSGFLDMLVAKRSGAGARGLRGRGDRRVCGLPFGAEGSTSRDEKGATQFFAQRNHLSLFHVGEYKSFRPGLKLGRYQTSERAYFGLTHVLKQIQHMNH